MPEKPNYEELEARVRVLDCNFCAKSEHLFLGLSSLNYCQVIEGLLMQLNKNAHYRMA
jgi:hypothetical protein